jgi:hypothetical protein
MIKIPPLKIKPNFLNGKFLVETNNGRYYQVTPKAAVQLVVKF